MRMINYSLQRNEHSIDSKKSRFSRDTFLIGSSRLHRKCGRWSKYFHGVFRGSSRTISSRCKVCKWYRFFRKLIHRESELKLVWLEHSVSSIDGHSRFETFDSSILRNTNLAVLCNCSYCFPWCYRILSIFNFKRYFIEISKILFVVLKAFRIRFRYNSYKFQRFSGLTSLYF